MRIKEYEVGKTIYEDAIGKLHAANSEDLNKVIFKILHERYSDDPQLVEAFHRGADVYCSLESKNHVQTLGHGEEDGVHFIMLEDTKLSPLEKIIENHNVVSVLDTITFIEKLAVNLRSYHLEGIIHGHLSPQNIFTNRDLTEIKFSDFGFDELIHLLIAKDQVSSLSESPHYSPEILHGQNLRDRRSDIFSIGVLFYQMLVGELPWIQGPFTDHDTRANRRLVIPPSLQRLEIPESLDNLVLEALSFDIEARCQNLSQFINKLYRSKSAEESSGLVATDAQPPADDWRDSSDLGSQQDLAASSHDAVSGSSTPGLEVAAPGRASLPESDDERLDGEVDLDRLQEEPSGSSQILRHSIDLVDPPIPATGEREDAAAEDAGVSDEIVATTDDLNTVTDDLRVDPKAELETTGDPDIEKNGSQETDGSNGASKSKATELDDHPPAFEELSGNTDQGKTTADESEGSRDSRSQADEIPDVEEPGSDEPSFPIEEKVNGDVTHEHTEEFTPTNGVRARENGEATNGFHPDTPAYGFADDENSAVQTLEEQVNRLESDDEHVAYSTPYGLDDPLFDRGEDIREFTATQTADFATTQTINLYRAQLYGKPAWAKPKVKVLTGLALGVLILSAVFAFRFKKDASGTTATQNALATTELQSTQKANGVPTVAGEEKAEATQADLAQHAIIDLKTKSRAKESVATIKPKEPIRLSRSPQPRAISLQKASSQRNGKLAPASEPKIDVAQPRFTLLNVRIKHRQEPQIAEVFLNGELVGTSSKTGFISIPKLATNEPHLVKVQSNGFEMWAKELEFDKAGPVDLHVSLVALPTPKTSQTTSVPNPGTVNVLLTNSGPINNALVYVNGKLWQAGSNSVPTKLELPAGNHVVEVRKLGYRTAPPSYRFDLKEGRHKTVYFYLSPKRASQRNILTN